MKLYVITLSDNMDISIPVYIFSDPNKAKEQVRELKRLENEILTPKIKEMEVSDEVERAVKVYCVAVDIAMKQIYNNGIEHRMLSENPIKNEPIVDTDFIVNYYSTESYDDALSIAEEYLERFLDDIQE